MQARQKSAHALHRLDDIGPHARGRRRAGVRRKQGGEVRTARSEWAISHLTPNTTTVGSTGFNGTDNSVAVDLDEPGRVTPGSMIMVGSEQIWVHPDGVSSTGLVAGRYERGIGGTTIAAHGDGVKVDFNEAAKWYRRAADQGHAMAQGNLLVGGAGASAGVGSGASASAGTTVRPSGFCRSLASFARR